MFRNNANDKKRTLLAHKEKLLQEIQYYEKKIDEFSNKSSNIYFGADSSDSEDGFPTYLDIGPSISELRSQDRLLKTCLQATQELTSVTVLESEVQILVKDPDIGSEKAVTEPGLWREVTAECRMDLVPFTILLYVHQPSRRFSPASYRGLRVSPVKTAHEAELSASILHTLTTPADVLETIRSYAVAYRSRRGTLARLADRHAGAVYMQPREAGGFVLRCGAVMQMSWRLENKKSPLAPFQHKMNFELEYMDESFLKIVKQAHRQLSDPSLQTDERTQLLSKIISTCIEAQGQDESDTESRKLERTILDDDDDMDKEVMAPPKSIPKRSKPKGKENDDGNRKSVKRNAGEVDVSVKKARTDFDTTDGVDSRLNKVNGESVDKNHSAKDTGRLDKNNASAIKNKISQVNASDKKVSEKITKTGQERVGDPKKKKNDLENKTQKNKTSAKNIEDKNDKENHKKTAKDTEQKKQTEKVTVNTKISKNIKTNVDDVSKNSKTNRAQVDSKISETVHATKTAKDSNSKKTGNSINNKKVENSETSKSKKNSTSETNNTKKVSNSETDNKTNATKTDNKKDIRTQPTSNKGTKPTSVQNTITTDTANAKVAKPKITKPESDNAKKITTDTANAKVPKPKITKPESDNVKKTDDNSSKQRDEVDRVKPANAKINATGNAKNIVISKTKKIGNSATNNVKKIAVDNAKSVTKTKESGNNDLNNAKKIANLETDLAKKSVNSATKQIENTDTNDKTNSIAKKNNMKSTTNISKNPKDTKSKMVIKNHRNSNGKVTKTLKPSFGKESKIPQKKLSPAYAAVLQQNPIRISPRMLSKFKSTSDSNIQSKIFKPVTNIPRLLKKPAPKSK